MYAVMKIYPVAGFTILEPPLQACGNTLNTFKTTTQTAGTHIIRSRLPYNLQGHIEHVQDRQSAEMGTLSIFKTTNQTETGTLSIFKTTNQTEMGTLNTFKTTNQTEMGTLTIFLLQFHQPVRTTMNNALGSIINEIPVGYIFDSHFIINQLIRNQWSETIHTNASECLCWREK